MREIEGGRERIKERKNNSWKNASTNKAIQSQDVRRLEKNKTGEENERKRKSKISFIIHGIGKYDKPLREEYLRKPKRLELSVNT